MFSIVEEYLISSGGYHEYRGGVQYCGDTQITKDDILYVTELPCSGHDTPHMYHDIPMVVNIP